MKRVYLFIFVVFSYITINRGMNPELVAAWAKNDVIKTITTLEPVTKGIMWPLWFINDIYRMIDFVVDKSKTKREVKNINNEKLRYAMDRYCKIGEINDIPNRIKNLDDNLNKIIGQDSAKEQLRDFLLSVMYDFYSFDLNKKVKNDELHNKLKEINTNLEGKKYKKMNKKKKKKYIKNELLKYSLKFGRDNLDLLLNGPGPKICLLYGPPGVGKTEIVLLASSCLTENVKKPYIIDASSVYQNGGNFSSLFKNKQMDEKNNSPSMAILSDTNVYVKNVKRGILLINEVDKILANENTKKDFNEFLRTIIDNRYIIDGNGKQIDMSGFVIFLTSNGKVKKDQKDITGGMTEDSFDPSCSSRIKKIYLSSLTEQNYKDFLKMKLNKIVSDFENDYKKYSIKIIPSENIFDILAHRIYTTPDMFNEGARCVDNDIIPPLKALLFEKIINLENTNTAQQSKINIDYGEATNKFILSN